MGGFRLSQLCRSRDWAGGVINMSVPLWLLRSDPHLHFHRRPASPTIIIVLRCTSTPVSAKKTSLWWRANSSFVITPCDPQFQGWKRCRRAHARNDVFFAGRCTLEMKLPNIDIEGGRGRWQHALSVVAKFFRRHRYYGLWASNSVS